MRTARVKFHFNINDVDEMQIVDSFIYGTFDNDGWDNSGTFELYFEENKLRVTCTSENGRYNPQAMWDIYGAADLYRVDHFE